MKAAVHRPQSSSVVTWLDAMVEGLSISGISSSRFQDMAERDADFAVVWGWRRGMAIRAGGFNKPILVMERGYLGDRFQWTSLGWDGLNGRARFPTVDDAGERFEEHFSHLMRPQRVGGDYALLVGQVRGDTALANVDIIGWYRATAKTLIEKGMDVVFRPHPREIERNAGEISIPGTKKSTRSLADDLAGASLVATYNSNTGTDAVMAGVPVHAEDEGSMVWDIASHNLSVFLPDRLPRLHQMAWFQWRSAEIRSGQAWEVVREAM